MSSLDSEIEISERENAGFRDSKGDIIQPSDGRRFWHERTPLDKLLKSCVEASDHLASDDDWRILEACYNKCREAKVEVFTASDIIRPEILKAVLTDQTKAQFEAHRDKKCLLVLGNCPQYNISMPVFGSSNTSLTQAIRSGTSNAPTAFTIDVLRAVAEKFGPTIGLDVRKVCRKYQKDNFTKDYSPCRSIDPFELRRLLWATKLEMIIAEREYGITWTSCFAFSGYPCRIAERLGIDKKNVAKSYYHIADCARQDIFIYQKWKLAGMILRDITEELAGLSDQWTQEDLYDSLAATMKKANQRLKIPDFDLKPESDIAKMDFTQLRIVQDDLKLKEIVGELSTEDEKDLKQCTSLLERAPPKLSKSIPRKDPNEHQNQTTASETGGDIVTLSCELKEFLSSVSSSSSDPRNRKRPRKSPGTQSSSERLELNGLRNGKGNTGLSRKTGSSGLSSNRTSRKTSIEPNSEKISKTFSRSSSSSWDDPTWRSSKSGFKSQRHEDNYRRKQRAIGEQDFE